MQSVQLLVTSLCNFKILFYENYLLILYLISFFILDYLCIIVNLFLLYKRLYYGAIIYCILGNLSLYNEHILLRIYLKFI